MLFAEWHDGQWLMETGCNDGAKAVDFGNTMLEMGCDDTMVLTGFGVAAEVVGLSET